MNYIARIYNYFIYRVFLKLKLAKCGKNFRIGYRSELLNPHYFQFGDCFYSGPYAYFVTNKNFPITVGNYVIFGPFVKIIGGNHDTKYTLNHMYFNHDINHDKGEIKIEDGAWVGANSIILSHSHISEGAVIGANSLVNSYIPPYSVAVGSPAVPIKCRFNKIKDLETVLTNTKSKYQIDHIIQAYKQFGITLS